MASVINWWVEDEASFEFNEHVEATIHLAAEVDELDGDEGMALRRAFPQFQRWQAHPTIRIPGPLGSPRTPHVQNFSPKLEKGTNLFRIEVFYSTRVDAESPLDRATKFRYTTTDETEVITRDGEGKPLVNKAMELIDGVEEVRKYFTIHVTAFVPRVPVWAAEYTEGVINSDAVTVEGVRYKKETLKLDRMEIGEWEEENDVRFKTVQFSIIHKRETWRRWFPNVGWTQIVKNRVGKWSRRPCESPDGKELDRPQWLDKNGKQIDLVESYHPVTYAPAQARLIRPDEMIFLDYFTQKRLPFSRLPLR